MKKLLLVFGALVSGAVVLFAATGAEQPAAEVKPTPVPFKILNPFRVRRTRSHSIRLIHWGKDTYRYEGKIEFDGIVAKGDFRNPPLAVLKYGDRYYFICWMFMSSHADFHLYDGKSIRSIPFREVPFEVLTYRFPDDFPKVGTYRSDFYIYILRKSLRTDQRLCQKILRYYLSEGLVKAFKFLGLSDRFCSDLFRLAIYGKIDPELKELFFRDITDIIRLGLTEEHSYQSLCDYFFILCCLDYPRAVAFADVFCSEYEQADKAGKLQVFNHSDKLPDGTRTIKSIKREIADFEEDLKRYREYNNGHPDLYPLP